MKRILILCSFLFLSETMGSCAVTFFPPLQPINQGNSIQRYSSNLTTPIVSFNEHIPTNYSNLIQIEQSIFGRNFGNQDISTRLTRIEKSLFTTTYPSSTNAQRIDNIISNFNQMNKYPNISTNVLSRIESKIFNQSFPQYTPEQRIERLEGRIFGAIQSGRLDSRYELLKTAANNYRNPYIQNASRQMGWKGIISALGSSIIGKIIPIGGSMTGFTPPIAPYGTNSYVNSYNNDNRYPFQSSYSNMSGTSSRSGLNSGYSNNYQTFGSGSGVTILN